MIKKILAMVAVLGLAFSSAYAGCGKKVEVTGTFKYDAETKSLTVEGAKKPIKLQKTTKVTGADGKETTIDKLDGKITVIHEHNKADSVAPAKKKAA